MRTNFFKNFIVSSLATLSLVSSTSAMNNVNMADFGIKPISSSMYEQLKVIDKSKKSNIFNGAKDSLLSATSFIFSTIAFKQGRAPGVVGGTVFLGLSAITGTGAGFNFYNAYKLNNVKNALIKYDRTNDNNVSSSVDSKSQMVSNQSTTLNNKKNQMICVPVNYSNQYSNRPLGPMPSYIPPSPYLK